ncbi:putative toxin-antitoxin system toxin component, PIN family [Caldanaerobacter subterraneus]|uniref:Putative toxin-antitoxin system toxin component, PIN family n=1 Tax=Caldanaerobacter subterraneus TaxID=911092 RepID=A0A7Y2L4M5_9THEO|nr:putative toxin-antitoxin system toxin component, PIN family [Caldanaerobacter subterraneus]NNG65698.1 putative toxin-antitoxin system toxin component, PIN family [Caldanaerobacter subterraneus]
MRAVIDTNVLISGIISKKSYPAKIINYWILNKFDPVVSPEIVEEYAEVLTRDRFSALGTVSMRLDFLNKLLSLDWVLLVYPKEKFNIIEEDSKDNIFLECAFEGRCDFIISGDHHLLQLKRYENIKIITAEEFINLLA